MCLQMNNVITIPFITLFTPSTTIPKLVDNTQVKEMINNMFRVEVIDIGMQNEVCIETFKLVESSKFYFKASCCLSLSKDHYVKM